MVDLNVKRKAEIGRRAQKTGSRKIRRYVTNDLLPKLDQAGEHAGAWLEALEADFDTLADDPQGLLKDFEPEDFDALFSVMFGYKRLQE